MLDRVIGVFKLSSNTFEEIEHDQNATGEAAIVVAVVALLAAIGSGIGATAIGNRGFFGSFISTLIWVFVAWIVWSAVTFFVGTAIFGGKADMGEMLRVTGYAFAPQVLGIIPCIGWIIGLIWTLAALFVAARQGLDLDNTKTALTVVVGLIVYLIGAAILNLLIGGIGALF
jgi:hypothetical protein